MIGVGNSDCYAIKILKKLKFKLQFVCNESETYPSGWEEKVMKGEGQWFDLVGKHE